MIFCASLRRTYWCCSLTSDL